MTYSELHNRYRREIDAFNANAPDDGAEFDRVAESTFLRTRARLLKTPIRTKADAVAALSFLEGEVRDYATVGLERLFPRLRAYIEAEVRS